MNVSQYIDSLKLVIRNTPNEVGRIIDKNKETILDLNRENQLNEKGIDSKDTKLQEYAYFTIQIKQLIGQPFDRTTLFYSGKFHAGFKYKYTPETFTLEIYSDDEKSSKLVAKYGVDIFGLNESNKLYLTQSIIKPNLDKWLLKYL
jgi:hypothetical protein